MSLSFEEISELLTGPGQPFEIEQLEIDGVPIRDWKHKPPTLAAFVEQSRQFGDKEFIIYEGERLSYAEHYRRVASVANYLVDELGVQKGDRVAIAMRNYPEWSIAFWAATAVGAVAVPLNAWWTSDELAYGLSDSGARVVVADEERLKRIQRIESALPVEHILAVRCNDVPGNAVDFAGLLEGRVDALPSVSISPEDNATLFYTSGTTGFPKGTLGTQRNFCGAALTVPYSSAQNLLRSGMTQEDLAAMQQISMTIMLTVPLFHVTGCHAMLLGTFSAGGKMVMMYKWDPVVALDLIEKESVNFFAGVPTMARQLIDANEKEQRDLSSVMNVGYGGAPAPPELLRAINNHLPRANATNGWGITETSAAITGIGGRDYAERPDSVGRAVPVCDVKVVSEKGEELAAGQLGELWVRGPNVVKGYWNKPEATAESFSDGWFHTGDVGRIDEEGFIYIVDRLKDMIIRGGENVYCAEVEAGLTEHPLVKVACVFGVPHEILGEEVAAVVEIGPDDSLDEQELKDYAKTLLAAYKIPSRIWLHREPLPLGATGKVQKKALKAHYVEYLASAGGQ